MHLPNFEVSLKPCSFLIWASFWATATSTGQDFSSCISSDSHQYGTFKIAIPSDSPTFLPIFRANLREPRFYNTSSPKPLFIIAAKETSHVQGAIVCARRSGLQVRIRSGGHDYEGLSSTSEDPFVLIDLSNLRSVRVDVRSESAWVDSGATVGDLYFRIAERSNVYAFPAGSCSTVGIGGHLGCGGFGFVFRKYGLAADNVLDAKIIDANGRLLTRATMGEDLFWAIRGGGGASFGVIVSWKVRLVPVPPIVTRLSVAYTLEEGGARLLQKWQSVASRFPEDLHLRVGLSVIDSTGVSLLGGKKTVLVSFEALYLGSVDQLLWLLRGSFPELNVSRKNFTEMTWIQSAVDLAEIGVPFDGPPSVLLNRTTQQTAPSKMKSDYVMAG
nr:PREDICTED: flavin-dependent oxidoreductase FOX2-like [Bemisia tabaci]